MSSFILVEIEVVQLDGIRSQRGEPAWELRLLNLHDASFTIDRSAPTRYSLMTKNSRQDRLNVPFKHLCLKIKGIARIADLALPGADLPPVAPDLYDLVKEAAEIQADLFAKKAAAESMVPTSKAMLGDPQGPRTIPDPWIDPPPLSD